MAPQSVDNHPGWRGTACRPPRFPLVTTRVGQAHPYGAHRSVAISGRNARRVEAFILEFCFPAAVHGPVERWAFERAASSNCGVSCGDWRIDIRSPGRKFRVGCRGGSRTAPTRDLRLSGANPQRIGYIYGSNLSRSRKYQYRKRRASLYASLRLESRRASWANSSVNPTHWPRFSKPATGGGDIWLQVHHRGFGVDIQNSPVEAVAAKVSVQPVVRGYPVARVKIYAIVRPGGTLSKSWRVKSCTGTTLSGWRT